MAAQTCRSMLAAAAAAITAAKRLCQGFLRFLRLIQQTGVALDWSKPGCGIEANLRCLGLGSLQTAKAILEVGSGLWRSTLEVCRCV